jgi:hypothetical protein
MNVAYAIACIGGVPPIGAAYRTSWASRHNRPGFGGLAAWDVEIDMEWRA